MKTSANISNFSTAFLAAQMEIESAKKNATNPDYKMEYADLASVISAVKPALNKHGIVFLQSPSPSDDGFMHLTTRLIHAQSGEWIEDTAVSPMAKQDPQGFGSASTYLRRYSLAALCGLFQVDDDAASASFAPGKGKAASATTASSVEGKSSEADKWVEIIKTATAERAASAKTTAKLTFKDDDLKRVLAAITRRENELNGTPNDEVLAASTTEFF